MIVTPMTFVSTVHSIVNAGLEPVFADIDPETFCLSPEEVERVLTPDVCAVVPVHLYGHVCDVDYFEKLRGRGIRVIYDAAHAFGVKYRGESIGLFGDAEVFSFHATKILNACEGGAVITRDEKLADRIRLMTNFGILNETEVECVGTNGKLSEVHALFGLSSLSHMGKAIERRVALSKHYLTALRSVPRLRFPLEQKGVTPNGQFFPVLLPDQRVRDALYDHLTACEIYARKNFYPPIHRLKPYERLATRPLPVAKRSREYSLPAAPFIVDRGPGGARRRLCRRVSGERLNRMLLPHSRQNAVVILGAGLGGTQRRLGALEDRVFGLPPRKNREQWWPRRYERARWVSV